jgi:hypothetical protein
MIDMVLVVSNPGLDHPMDIVREELELQGRGRDALEKDLLAIHSSAVSTILTPP